MARARREWLVFFILGALLVAGAAVVAGSRAGEAALATLRAQAGTAARLKVAVLRSEIERHRSLPLVLSQDPDVAAALARPGDAALVRAMNEKFEGLSTGTRVGVIYLIDAGGRAIAASNWRTSTSFVGLDYSFRPYYSQTTQTGAAEYFAMGTVSHRPGLYLARRVGAGLGVIVIKVEFDAVEADWVGDHTPVLVTDPQGIVMLSDHAHWRFRTLAPIPEAARIGLRASLQFGDAPLDPLPLQRLDNDLVRLDNAVYAEAALPVPTTDWTLHLYAAVQPALGRAEAGASLIAGLAVLVAMVPAGIFLRRRRRALERRAFDEATRAELERQVAARTQDLTTVNDRLSTEMDERRRADQKRQQLQDELAQANRLAILGQISASVAHEINQPVAAIRAYADNAGVFIDRGDSRAARENLGLIAALTERVGSITGQLRNFSRRATHKQGLVSVNAAIDGALLLTGHRIRRQGAEIIRRGPEGEPAVSGDPVRLEQVLVNLLQNALDAVADQAVPAITITVCADRETVQIEVEDNGGGIAPEILEQLFTPFVTSKPAGLGLGLVISSDIVNDFGGTMSVANSEGGGAVFTVRLPRA
ncbi:sensor histidine kinase [Oleomonas cavernae]|uniref:C4-dicarboxylate transport sensor protein DctB n=1 Tax=Oleomonas cavernae TaxID=2320859 RepID=A0A418WEL4_9PROT|nr:ATP-binding protein [Oleomonas cavernae]RJF88457.1 sensor histidine kinase [Oleomonas cavernae]